jgi:hypothetical protein
MAQSPEFNLEKKISLSKFFQDVGKYFAIYFPNFQKDTFFTYLFWDGSSSGISQIFPTV